MDQLLNWSLVLLVFVLSSQVTDVLSGHHHIKLRHERHRRQHVGSYLPASFVSDTDEEELGTWGPWSTPSSCSRSCGGGVAFQSRICRDVDESTGTSYCRGAAKRFFSCNVQPCPGPATDFRAEQCAEFNDIPVEGIKYDWIPYTGGANKCELNCMPRGERFFYRHKLSVTDGTPCTLEQNDVCVQGKCRHVGCDLMLGSDAKEDNCRECGGDGSACNTVQGLLDMNDLVVGYNDILLIPAGATNIAISEVRPSNNYLAIRNSTGHYYLNGNWRIDFPRSLRFAGSVFHYERRPKEFSAADIINALGPINEALYIVLLSQDTNVGVNYEYSIPKRFSQQTKPDGYDWVADEFSECSTTCGGGIKSRLVRCVRRGDGEEGDAELCDPEFEPQGTQSCGEDPCPPKWEIGEWGPCSKKCGSGGEQTREIKCKQLISRNINSTVDDSQCLEYIGPKDIEIQECNKGVECPQWHIGPWKPCDRLCGAGNQTRKITCYKKVNGKISVMDDSDCPDERPESEKECNLRPCVGVDWVFSAWSGCDFKCGLTHQTRTATCMSLDGEIYPDEQCNPETKPELVTECSTEDKCSFQWYTTQWSECSSKCGAGIQTRKVFCGTSPSGGDCLTEVEDEKCDADKKYNSTQECTTEADECKGEWFTGPWSECSQKCGGGDRTRKVFCMKDDKVVPDEGNCDQEDFMPLSESCNEKSCNEDETIPGPGTSYTPEDDPVECEDYEDEEFHRVDSDLDVAFQNDEGYSSDINSLQRSIYEIMMGDEPTNDLTIEDSEVGSGTGVSDEAEGSGSTPDDTSTFDTASTDWSSTITTESSLSTEEGSTYSTDAPTTSENELTTDDPKANLQTTTQHLYIEKTPLNPHKNTPKGEILPPEESETTPSASTSSSSDVITETISTTDVSTSDSTSDATSISESETTEPSSTGDTSESSASTDIISTVEAESTSSGSSTSSTDSASTDLSSSDSTVSSGTETTVSSIADTDETPTSDTTVSESSESTVSSSSDTSVLSTSETSPSSDSGATQSTDGETQETSDSSTTESGLSTESEGSTTGGTEDTTLSGSTETNETTEPGTTVTDETTDSGSTLTDETTESGSTGTDEATESGSTGTDETTESGPTGTDETTESGFTETDEATQSGSTGIDGTTESGSTGTDETTESGSTGTDETTESGSTETDETTESGSTGTDETTESGSTETDETTESGSTGTDESTESGSTGTDETTESGSTGTDGTTESGSTSVSGETETTSDTTESEITESYETTDTTEQSHITDRWTTISKAIRAESRPKCRPRKHKKTCKESEFGCCYDGIKAAKGPFAKGCPIPKTCKETEFGCCPDGVSPAYGHSDKGCPDSHCSETLFGCCQDDKTPAEGNDYEGCPVLCKDTKFGCCPDNETPAVGKDNLGCCNVTEHGCCPDGIKSATGPDGEGCIDEESSTVPYTSTITDSATTESEGDTESTSSSTSVSSSSVSPSTIETSDITTVEAGCELSEFGCCPDNETPATGEHLEGCHLACENSTFGCCDDGSTPAHGPNQEGCCLASPHKCCPDNIREALGPDFYGCGCQYARYRCCPDNVTTALGPNNEGCGCQHAPHGCCPNQITAASGPKFEGCPCHTYQFGCCPDGVSVARGPQNQGCGCENTEFKCCSDGVTPAKGENYAGCTCDASKFGCCPDGVEEAQGENFEGCLTVPITPGAACALEKDRGTCSNFSVRWFFDTEYGGCSRFWYGGCDGNENRFKSQEECKDVCVEPKGRDACFLPKIAGPCEGYNPIWYYDAERKQCGQFVYSGCLGNANRFKTMEDCEELCVEPDDADPCEQDKEVGPCEGNFTRWYFNKQTDSCEVFTYGGCKANKNNFATQISCQQQCLRPGHSRVQDVCALDKDTGPCPGSLLRWYYDAKRKSCRQFVFGGCKGNGNKFRTYAACEQRCPVRDSCSLPREEGTCTEKQARWSFDQTESRCMPFYYTGCGGNRNNYETEEACDNDCPAKIEQDTCLLPAIMGECHNYTQRWYYDSYDQRCKRFYYGGCGGNGNNFENEQDCTQRCESSAVPPPPITPVTAPPPVTQDFRIEFCFQPEEYGPCDRETVKWFYDTAEGNCRQFRYGGCGSNGNNFDTREECEQRCGNVQDVCELPKYVVGCGSAEPQYYYDSRSDSCVELEYGRCSGNKNRFGDKSSCENRCRKSTDGPTTATTTTTTTTIAPTTQPRPRKPLSPICSAPRDSGPCNGDEIAYYYDVAEGGCKAFTYGGCEGNANRFQTIEQCERLCGSFQGQDVCNVPVDGGPCRAAFPKFYFDPITRKCQKFLYGGCDGSANRFSSENECETVCVHREEPTPGNNSITDLAICKEPVDIGSCEPGKYWRYYYNDERLDCIAFIYTGCGGNLNRFKSYDACRTTCLLPILNELQPKPEPTNPCELARAECDAIRCQFGKEESVDANDCTRCRCVDPCLNINCQEGTKCAVDRVSRGDELVSQAVCRPILKPGNCPRLSNSTTCQKECDSDADCESDFKCCSIGCGSSCLEPAPVEPITTPVPTYDPVPYPGAVPAHVEPPAEPNIRAQEGGYVLMKCVATGNPRPVITWRKGVTLINNSVSRYSVTVEGSLQIVGLYTTDAGTYTCTVDNHVAAPVRIQYELEVTGPSIPHVPVIIGERDYRVTVNLNSPATLECRAWGWPRPVISWWHESRLLPVADTHYQYQRDYSLKIHRVSLVDLGVYTCQAYNGINKPSSWSVTLQAPGPVYDENPAHQKYLQYLIAPQRRPSPPNVRPPPPYVPRPTAAPTTPKPPTYAPYYPEEKPSIPGVIDLSPVIVPNKYTAPVKVNLSVEPGPFPVGSEFSIACDVEGFPVPTVTWYKDDTPIQPDNRIKIYGANRLAVSNVVKNDAGNYRCEAVNQFTRDDKSVDINVEGIYVSPYCQDSPFFANCALIVKGKYCQHDYYAKFCCRSCTEAGELPARPPHINDARRRRRSLLTFF